MDLLLEPKSLQSLATLALAALIVMGSPGPSTVSVTAVASAFGLRRSLAYVVGLILGTCLVLAAVAAGIASILLSHPRLGPLLLAASAAYILYLAFKIATALPLAAADRHARAPSFGAGLLLAAANPKAYVAIAAVFAGSRLEAMSPFSETLAKIAVLVAMIVFIHVAWLVAGAVLARSLREPRTARAINLAFSAVLVISTFMAFLY